MRRLLKTLATLGMLGALLLPRPTSAEAPVSPMMVVLVDDAGIRSAAYSALGGTIVISRNDPGHSAEPATDAIAPDRANLAFEPLLLGDKALLAWLAGSGPRSISVTQSQDGAGQISLVLGAEHASLNGVTLN